MSQVRAGSAIGWIVAIGVVLAWCHWHLPDEIDVDEAGGRGWVDLEPQYAEPDRLSVTVTLDRSESTTVVVPAGTIYRSGRPGAQDLIAGQTVRVRFTGGQAPQHQVVSQEVYCLQRRLRTPDVGERFAWNPGGGEEMNSIRKLVGCLEQARAESSHTDRQIAVWIVAEKLLDDPAGEAERKFRDFLRQRLTHAADEELDKLRSTLAKSFGNGKAMTDKEARKYIEDFRGNQLAALVETRLDEELRTARQHTRPLLRSCGYNVDASPFFAEAAR